MPKKNTGYHRCHYVLKNENYKHMHLHNQDIGQNNYNNYIRYHLDSLFLKLHNYLHTHHKYLLLVEYHHHSEYQYKFQQLHYTRHIQIKLHMYPNHQNN